jgi:hypothetical protein
MTTDVHAGKDLGTLDLTITDEMVQHYIKGLDEPNPWYTTTSPFGEPVAPVIVYQDADSQFKGWYLDNLFGNLWRRQEWEIYAPTRVGQTLRCTARVAERYRRRDRDVVAMEMWVRDDAAQLQNSLDAAGLARDLRSRPSAGRSHRKIHPRPRQLALASCRHPSPEARKP